MIDYQWNDQRSNLHSKKNSNEIQNKYQHFYFNSSGVISKRKYSKSYFINITKKLCKVNRTSAHGDLNLLLSTSKFCFDIFGKTFTRLDADIVLEFLIEKSFNEKPIRVFESVSSVNDTKLIINSKILSDRKKKLTYRRDYFYFLQGTNQENHDQKSKSHKDNDIFIHSSFSDLDHMVNKSPLSKQTLANGKNQVCTVTNQDREKNTICDRPQGKSDNTVIYKDLPDLCQRPCDIAEIRKDGNCFFNCISLCLLGHQNEHAKLRNSVIEHAVCNTRIFEPLCRQSNLQLYLLDSNMERDGTWATDFEIIVMAHLIKMNINIYSDNRWQFFRPNFIDENRESNGNINLTLNNDHFEVILNMSQNEHNSIDIQKDRREIDHKCGEKIDEHHDSSFEVVRLNRAIPEAIQIHDDDEDIGNQKQNINSCNDPEARFEVVRLNRAVPETSRAHEYNEYIDKEHDENKKNSTSHKINHSKKKSKR